MKKPNQISFRPDPGIKYAYDRLLGDLKKENPKNRSLNKDLLSRLIEEEYIRKYGETSCFKVDRAIDWDNFEFSADGRIEASPKYMRDETIEILGKNGWKDWTHFFDDIGEMIVDEDYEPVPADKVFNREGCMFEVYVPGLEFEDLVDLYEAKQLTQENLTDFTGFERVDLDIDDRNGGLTQMFWAPSLERTFVLRHIHQSFFADTLGTVRERLKRNSTWLRLVWHGHPDLDSGTVLQDHITKDNERYVLIQVDGELWSKTTKVDDEGKEYGVPLVTKVGGKGDSSKTYDSEVAKVFLGEGTEAIKTLGKKVAHQGGDIEDLKSELRNTKDEDAFEATCDFWEAQIRMVIGDWWKPDTPWKAIRQKARRIKDDPETSNVDVKLAEHYKQLLPPHIGCSDPDGVSDIELRENATPENIDTVLGRDNVHAVALRAYAPNHEIQGQVGKGCKDYFELVRHSEGDLIGKVHSKGMSRQEVLDYCQNKKYSSKGCFLVINAFMASRKDNVMHAWKTIDSITPVLDQFRSKADLTRAQAYQALKTLKDTGNLKGLRPATWCSLIYFMRQKQDGYMLSTHTAKSVNLLATHNNPIIEVNQLGYPQDTNTANAYELYCRILDGIGRMLNCSGGDAEEILQSSEKQEWRKYLHKQTWTWDLKED